jgi:5-methyltetrahydropteroyltriglutamate--homocysteine methyltransferase
MITTVVGSYPSHSQGPSNFTEKISDFFGIYDEYKPAIKLAVQDQLKAGIDIISDGQVRGDMIKIFAQHIPGMIIENNSTKITGKIMSPNYSICASDLRFAIKTAQRLSQNFKQKSKKLGLITRGVKGILTGPTTLVYSSRIENFYENQKKSAIIDLAYVLKKEAEYLEGAGPVMIQIDEPFLSTEIVDIKIARKGIKIITKNLSVPISLHVCGNIQNVFNELLKFDVDIIDCEFAGNPQNLDFLENSKLNGKKIGFGCVNTKIEQVEGMEEVLNLIKKGIKIIGEENMLADPDCGMRMLPRNVAFSKLNVMTEAIKCLS